MFLMAGTALTILATPEAGRTAGRNSAIRTHSLSVAEAAVRITGNPATAVLLNGSLPGPILRFREGDEAVITVKNDLAEDTSIHWHGFLLPAAMDGVPGISFPGIKPGETFTYRFPVRQSGTYWYHSHSAGQELQGMFGAIVIEPAGGERHRAARDYVIMLSDWTDEPPLRVLANLKGDAGYYNYHKLTVSDFFREFANAPGATVQDRLDWGRPRMDPTDLSDVSGYTFLVNGRTPAENWTALFRAGERVRLRFVNAAGMTLFDVKIPGLPFSVVQADGQDVQPVLVDEFRIAPGETYDVLVEPAGGRAYTMFAQSLDRTGYARGTLAEREGMSASIPPLDLRPRRTMADMMGDMAGTPGMGAGSNKPMAMPPSSSSTMAGTPGTQSGGHDMPGMGEMNPAPGHPPNTPAAGGAWRKLRYADLRAMSPDPNSRPPDREVVLRLTGVMERYLWTINDKKLFESEPVRLRYGERVRITYRNETMMEHPMHMHGMFVGLQNGQGAFAPRKHTVIVNPSETLSVDFTANERGTWALHCHLLLHMVAGIFAKIVVGDEPGAAAARTSR
jgi:CopA family copper-resistance protein